MKYERLTNSSLAKSLNDVKYKTLGDELYVRLAEIEDKIENETLVELPCKMGDKVYVIYNNWETDELDIRITDVIGYEIMRDELWVKTSIPYRKNYIEINRVFLTKDEAEKRLEELRG